MLEKKRIKDARRLTPIHADERRARVEKLWHRSGTPWCGKLAMTLEERLAERSKQ
jgi:hypothetical protein